MQNIYNVKIEWIEFAHSLLTKQWDNIFCGVSIICHIKYGTSGLPSHASLTFGTWDHMSASKWRKNPEMHILGSHILYACVAVKQRELLAYLIRHFTTHSAAEFRSLLLFYIWMIWIDISGGTFPINFTLTPCSCDRYHNNLNTRFACNVHSPILSTKTENKVLTDW